ncbi:helix-turn-helix domain-containing protein [Rhodoferax bucti]|uniref:helix-turn-helix domain-containing protein n=1 Tax=Rhodoferax bucti TaxID=2576305 RepID=UPI001107DBE0|nr:helix-turn-helix transcriptional regulator [Rhodoferax bucti]
MKLSKALKSFVTESKKSDSYWVEAAKLEFAVGLDKQRKSVNMTYAAIAEKIGTSAAYITKIFRGDSNMTIESMVKLARATGGHLDVRVVPAEAASVRWDKASLVRVQKGGFVAPMSTPNTVVSLADYVAAANNDSYKQYRVAA